MFSPKFVVWAFLREAKVHNRTLVLTGSFLAMVFSFAVVFYSWSFPEIGVRAVFSLDIQYFQKENLLNSDQELPLTGDKITALDGNTIYSWPQFLRTVQQLPIRNSADGVPNTVRLGFYRPSDQTNHESLLLYGQTSLENMIPSFLWLVLKMAMVFAGGLILWWKPTEDSARQFFILGLVSLVAYMGGYHWWRIATQPILIFCFQAGAIFLPAVSLHFFMIFPKQKLFLVRRPLVTFSVVYGVPSLFLFLMITGYFRLRMIYGVDAASAEGSNFILREMLLEIYFYLAVAFVWFLGCIGCLIHSFRNASDETQRNQVKWILMGCIAALAPIVYSGFIVFTDASRFGRGGATWPMFAASLFVTASFSVSITRYKLIQLSQYLSSGFSYFLMSSLAGLIYYGIVFSGMLLVGTQFIEQPSLSQVAMVSGTAMIIILMLDRLRGRMKAALDRRFFKEKIKLDQTFRKMSQAIESLVDPLLMARRLLLTTTESLGVPKGSVFLKAPDFPGFKLADYLGNAPRQDVIYNDSVLAKVLLKGESVCLDLASMPSDPAIRKVLNSLGGVTIVPLQHEEDLTGFLVLGQKGSGAFTIDDLNLLAAFSQITVLGLVSAEGHKKIDLLNNELKGKVVKIAEQQNRILALQSQLSRGSQLSEVTDGQVTDALSVNTAGELHLNGQAQKLVGSSQQIKYVMELVGKVAPGGSAVLLRGESGTGKEVVAQVLHEQSSRADKPFVKVHCGALSAGLLESELFGHVKGAFTSAIKDKIGRFEAANGGTLFLDEIGDINQEVQIKLLRVLQEKIFEKVGSNVPIQVDVRIIAATHQNLEELIRQGKFRSDLFYRLNVFPITIPTLKERDDDIPELSYYFLQKACYKLGKTIVSIDDEALLCLRAFSWPGNIRQLENVIERGVVITSSKSLQVDDLPDEIKAMAYDFNSSVEVTNSGQGLIKVTDQSKSDYLRREKDKIFQALSQHGGNKSKASRSLGMARSTLVSRMKKLGLE
ncbi:MAG: sigma 54-interacting transcriptional regulator [Planctomycetota bacterium]|nr:sigma 54-interacting transcriptional regulator [Planctomycetota bacterium]